MDLLRYRKDDGELVVISDNDIKQFIKESNKTELAKFIYDRHYYRYIRPFSYESSN